jgi:hypothetical protein
VFLCLSVLSCVVNGKSLGQFPLQGILPHAYQQDSESRIKRGPVPLRPVATYRYCWSSWLHLYFEICKSLKYFIRIKPKRCTQFNVLNSYMFRVSLTHRSKLRGALITVYVFTSLSRTLISPQFRKLEMMVWLSNCFVQLQSLMMKQWGLKEIEFCDIKVFGLIVIII